MAKYSLLLVSSLFISKVSSHSWIHCSNYEGTIEGQDFDESLCTGYIREWSRTWFGAPFSTDYGQNYFGSNGAWCQTSFSTPINDMYDINEGFPYAEYYTGNEITLIWPAKNHANYECKSNNPDTELKLYYSPIVNRTSDPENINNDWIELVNFHDNCTPGTDGCGFQNCPKFCDDTDGAPCFGKFTINESDFPQGSGFYTFMWYWIFNPNQEPYTSCFEAYVYTTGSTSNSNGNGGNNGNNGNVTTTTYPTSLPTAPSIIPSQIPTRLGEIESTESTESRELTDPLIDNESVSNSPTVLPTVFEFNYIPDVCDSSPCSCDELLNCKVCHGGQGCSQCVDNYFMKDINTECEDCQEIFGNDCMHCNNFDGCAQCQTGTRTYDNELGLYYCM